MQVPLLNSNLLPNQKINNLCFFYSKTSLSLIQLTMLYAGYLHRRIVFSQIYVRLKRRLHVLLCVFACFASYIGATFSSKSHLKKIPRLPGNVCSKLKTCTCFKARPVGNIADQIKHSWCLLERCLSSVFQHTHPFANNLRQSPHTSSLESTNRLGCLHSNTSRRMAH